MTEPVFVTSVGIITSIGKNAQENFEALINEHSGIGQSEILETIHSNTLPVCEIKLEDAELFELAGISPGHGFTRTAVLGLIATQEAIAAASLTATEIKESAFISATTTGGIRELEKYFFDLQNADSGNGPWEEYRYAACPGEHAEHIADHLGIKKYVGTVSTACSSSANAIMMGARMIKHGHVERAICGGAESLSKFSLNGFNSLFILDKEHCKPFDNERRGLNLGEGAAYIVLESESAMKKSGRKPLAELKGYGNANDAFHLTASSPEGRGAMMAMNEALQTAGIDFSEIGYINAHGTATENNDLSEGLAIQKIFGSQTPYFSSTKPYTGHTLAAAGGVEAIYSIMALQHHIIFPNLNFSTPMKELNIMPVTKLLKANISFALSNSLGFGGNASSLLFGQAE